MILFFTELWHLLDVSAVAEHGAVLAAFLLKIFFLQNGLTINPVV